MIQLIIQRLKENGRTDFTIVNTPDLEALFQSLKEKSPITLSAIRNFVTIVFLLKQIGVTFDRSLSSAIHSISGRIPTMPHRPGYLNRGISHRQLAAATFDSFPPPPIIPFYTIPHSLTSYASGSALSFGTNDSIFYTYLNFAGVCHHFFIMFNHSLTLSLT